MATLDPPYIDRQKWLTRRARRGETYSWYRESLVLATGVFLPGPVPRPTNHDVVFEPGWMFLGPQKAHRSRARRWRSAERRSAFWTSDMQGRSTALHAPVGAMAPRHAAIARREWVEYRYPSVFRRPLVTSRPQGWLASLPPPRRHRSRIAVRAPNYWFNSFLHLKNPADRAFQESRRVRRLRRGRWLVAATPSVFGGRPAFSGELTPFPGEVI